MFILIL